MAQPSVCQVVHRLRKPRRIWSCRRSKAINMPKAASSAQTVSYEHTYALFRFRFFEICLDIRLVFPCIMFPFCYHLTIYPKQILDTTLLQPPRPAQAWWVPRSWSASCKVKCRSCNEVVLLLAGSYNTWIYKVCRILQYKIYLWGLESDSPVSKNVWMIFWTLIASTGRWLLVEGFKFLA